MRAEHASHSRGGEDEGDDLGELRIPLHRHLCRLATVDDVASVRAVEVAGRRDVRRQAITPGERRLTQ